MGRPHSHQRLCVVGNARPHCDVDRQPDAALRCNVVMVRSTRAVR